MSRDFWTCCTYLKYLEDGKDQCINKNAWGGRWDLMKVIQNGTHIDAEERLKLAQQECKHHES